VDEDTLSKREKMLLKRLRQDYTPEVVRDVLKPLVDQTSAVSLRALDWTVTNWSKQHNVVCRSLGKDELVNVHHAYRTTLSFWRRKLFDPFRRRRRIKVLCEGEELTTTLGQANFILFIYKTGILSYVLNNLETIEANMNSVSQRQKQDRKAALKRGIKPKRQELTASPVSICVAYVAPTRVRFE
jgi:hypothetical protein